MLIAILTVGAQRIKGKKAPTSSIVCVEDFGEMTKGFTYMHVGGLTDFVRAQYARQEYAPEVSQRTLISNALEVGLCEYPFS